MSQKEQPSQNSAVDPQALASVLGNDTSLHLGILKKFVLQTDELIVDFKLAHEQRNIEQIQFHAHKFKSSARTVGANNLADLCYALEQAARDGDWKTIDDLTGKLQPAVDQVEQYVSDLQQ